MEHSQMTTEPKLNFDEAMDRFYDGLYLKAKHVRADALRRKVWVAEWHIPGCMSESRTYCATKGDAIDAACIAAESEDGVPRGMRTALRKYGRFDSQSPMFGTCINTIECVTLADIL
jgi:hypothetical protein